MTAEAELGRRGPGGDPGPAGRAGPLDHRCASTGRGALAGTLWPLQLAGETDVGVRDFKVLTRSYQEGAGDPGILAFERGAGGRPGPHRPAAASTSTAPGSGSGAGTLPRRRRHPLQLRGRILGHGHRRGRPRRRRPHRRGALGRAGHGGGERGRRPLRLAAASRAGPGERASASWTWSSGTAHGRRPVPRAHPLRSPPSRGRRPAPATGRGGAWTWWPGPCRITARQLPRPRPRPTTCATRCMARLPRARVLRDALDAEVEVTGSAQGPAAGPGRRLRGAARAGDAARPALRLGRVAGRIAALAEARFGASELRRGAGRGARQRHLGPRARPSPGAWSCRSRRFPVDGPGPGAGAAPGRRAGTRRAGRPDARPRVRLEATGSGIAFRHLRLGTTRLEARVDGEQARVTAAAPRGWSLAGEAIADRAHPLPRPRRPWRWRTPPAWRRASRRRGCTCAARGELDADGELVDLARRPRRGAPHPAPGLPTPTCASSPPARRTSSASRGRWELAPLGAPGPQHRAHGERRLAPGRRAGRARPRGPSTCGSSPGWCRPCAARAGQLAVEARLSGTPVRAAGGRLRQAHRRELPGQGRHRLLHRRERRDGLLAEQGHLRPASTPP